MARFIIVIINILFPFIAAGYLLSFLLSPRKKLLKNLKNELAERFGFYNKNQPQRVNWLHAASVGEIKSAKQIINFLSRTYSSNPVLITTSTYAGKITAEKMFEHKVILAPLDFYLIIKKFIKTFKPLRLFVLESELWPNMFTACKNNTVPVSIINGRISAKSLKTLKLVKPLAKNMFKGVLFASVQTADIAERYSLLGMKKEKLHITGNIKYDLLDASPSKSANAAAIIEKLDWQNEKILVCGSTHPLEENIFISVFNRIKDELDLKIIIAPRHLERIEQIKTNLKTQNINFTLLSNIKTNENCQCLLADKMGWLSAFYSQADLCFVGGSMVNKGGHNLLEPAILKKPLIFGKNTQNSPVIAEKLLQNNGALIVTENNLKETLLKLMRNPDLLISMGQNGFKTAESFKGATQKNIELIKKYYEPKS
jgi:3-deoxy-D-manno-octulosonic-acid transferase